MKSLFVILFALCSVATAQDRPLKITTWTRVFHDDNVFNGSKGSQTTSSAYFSQTIGVDYSLLFSKAHTLSVKATPEIRYRVFDSEDAYFGGINARWKKEFGPKFIVDFKNGFNYAEREPSSLEDTSDINYSMNKFNGKLKYRLNYTETLIYEYENYFKRWSENAYVGNSLTNGDFDKHKHFASYERIMNKRFIGEIKVAQSKLTYQEKRGTVDSSEIQAHLKYVPNGYMIFNLSYGVSKIDSSNEIGNEYSVYSPTYGAGWTFFTPKGTTIGIKSEFETIDSSLTYWNAKDVLKNSLILKYEITPKLEISAMGMYLISSYQSEYSRDIEFDREEDTIVTSVTLSYKIDPIHYAEIGYQGFQQYSDSGDIERNKIFFGYRWNF